MVMLGHKAPYTKVVFAFLIGVYFFVMAFQPRGLPVKTKTSDVLAMQDGDRRCRPPGNGCSEATPTPPVYPVPPQ